MPGTPQPRYLGLDIGDKRIGVAASDPLGLLAQPVLTLHRGNPRDDMRSLRRLLRRHECAAIVAGLPLHLSGEAGPQAAKAERFARELGEMCGVPVYLWDERLTTAPPCSSSRASWMLGTRPSPPARLPMGRV